MFLLMILRLLQIWINLHNSYTNIFWVCILLFFFDRYLEVKWLGHVVCDCLTWKKCHNPLQIQLPFYILTRKYKFWLFYALKNLILSLLLILAITVHKKRYQWGFILNFLNECCWWELFHVLIRYIQLFSVCSRTLGLLGLLGCLNFHY